MPNKGLHEQALKDQVLKDQTLNRSALQGSALKTRALKASKTKMRYAALLAIAVLSVGLYWLGQPRVQAKIEGPGVADFRAIDGITQNSPNDTHGKVLSASQGKGTGPKNTGGVDRGGGGFFPPSFIKSLHKPGVVTYVNFWAEWCLPCKEELPLLAKWGQQFQKDRQSLQQAQKNQKKVRRIVLLHLDNTEFGYDAEVQQRARSMQKQLAPLLINLWAPDYRWPHQQSSPSVIVSKRGVASQQGQNNADQNRAVAGAAKIRAAASANFTTIQLQALKEVPLSQLPYHLIIDSHGRVAHHWGGAIVDEADIKAARAKLWGTR